MKVSGTKPRVFCILGMHRSGTSLISEISNLLGVHLGSADNMMRPAPDNPRGYWENQKLTDLNDEILARLGGRWDEIPNFSSNWEQAPELADLRQKARAFIEEEFAESEIWGWKDPRNCLTLPFWKQFLPEMHFVVCLRNPGDVARSLQRRNGFNYEKSVQLWLTYVKSVLEHTSGRPRLFLFYEDVMARGMPELKRLGVFLRQGELTQRPEIRKRVKECIDTQLQHNRTIIAEAVDDPNVSFYAKALFMLLRAYHLSRPASDKYERDQNFPEAIDRFSIYALSARNEKETLSQRIARLLQQQRRFQELEPQLSHLMTEKAELLRQFSRLQDTLESRSESLKASQHQLQLAAAERAGIVGQIAQLQAALDASNESRRQMEQRVSQLARLQTTLIRQDEALRASENRLNQATAEKSDLLDQITQISTVLEARDNSLQELEQRVSGLAAENTELHGQFAHLQAAFDAKEKSLLASDKASRELSATLNGIYASHGWKALSIYYRTRNRLFPPGSKRRNWARRLFHAVQASHIDFTNEESTGRADGTSFYQDFHAPASDDRVATAACTIVSKNYIAWARTLADSFHRFHPDLPFFVLLVDRIDGYFRAGEEQFQVVGMDELNIPNLDSFCFKYTIVELNTAVKPYFLARLFDKYRLKKLVFFDPDILITRNLSHIFQLLENHSVVLIPHITKPINDSYNPSELELLRAGIYNLGFIGLAHNPDTQALLTWWQKRLYEGCLMAPEQGMHVDQKWIDLVPAFFDRVCILRDPGYNVAYWNMQDRTVEFKNDEVLINGAPCYFFHFSGFDPGDNTKVSKHQNRFRMKDIGQGARLFEHYSKLVLANGHETIRAWPYAFDSFDNGVKIPSVARRMYHRLGRDRARFSNPFSTKSRDCYFNWLNEPADGNRESDIIITRFWKEIHSLRPDLQTAFPDIFGTHRRAFFHWMMNGGRTDSQIDESLVPRQTAVMTGETHNKANIMMAPRLYFHLLRPFETAFKPILKRTVGKNERLWAKIKQTRNRLIFAHHLAAPTISEGVARPFVDNGKPFGVNLAGYFRSEKGVGEAARAAARALKASSLPYVLNVVDDSGSINTASASENLSDKNPYSINLIHVNADQVLNFAAHKGDSYFTGRYNIGCWFWELSRFPEEWYPSFSYFHELWAPTGFIQDALSRVSPIPVTKMPIALSSELEIIAGLDRTDFGLSDAKFLFLSIFDIASVLERKNPLGLIEAFKMAFGNDDNVTLVLKVAHSDQYPSEFEALQRACGAGNIRVIDGIFSRQKLNTLLSFCDCYVSLHRSEGLGLPIAEAMTLGKPVVVTAYSGNMDFTTPANSFLVKYRLTEIDRDYGPYRKGWVWAEPDIDNAAELMRHVYENQELADRVGQRARLDISESYAPRILCEQMKERLFRLASMGKIRWPSELQDAFPEAAHPRDDRDACAEKTGRYDPAQAKEPL